MATLQSLTGGYQNIKNQAQGATIPNYNQAAASGLVYGPVNPNSGYAKPAATKSATTTYSGGNTSTPAASNSGNIPQIPTPEQPSIDFDALIRPALDALDQAISPLQQATEADIQGITSRQTTQKANTNASIGQQTNTINQAKTTQKTYENNAADEARRQFSEVQQGLQSRFGGTTGTGAFATEYAGGQAIRSISNVRQAAAAAQKALDDKLLQVQEVGRVALQDIDNQAADQIAKAKANLELQLSDIRQQKGNLLANKATMAANAIQAYQQTLNQVNTANAQFKQQLYAQQQTAEQNLQTAMSKAQGITSAATPEDLVAYVQGIQNQVAGSGLQVSATQKLSGGGSVNLSSSGSDSNDTASILKDLGLQ